MFKNRSTGELLILIVAFTVCGYVFISVAVVVILSFTNPGTPGATNAARNIADIINTLIGLLAGFLAGRTDSITMKKDETPKEPPV